MRKADYSHLARLIHARVTIARVTADKTTDPETLRAAQALLRTMEELAHDFARHASVDRVEFLNACGV